MTRLTLEGLACPDGVERRPVCGVVVAAAAAGVTFDEAWKRFAKFYGPRWTGATHKKHRDKVLKDLGVRLKAVPVPRPMTLKTALRLLRPRRRYIVWTSGHIQIVQGGMVLDQAGPRPVAGDWTGRKRVVLIQEIEE